MKIEPGYQDGAWPGRGLSQMNDHRPLFGSWAKAAPSGIRPTGPYSVEDHAPPEGGLGVPLNHPRFLEWVGAPASAWLLEMSPGQWCDTLSRDQAITAAMQLHKDACLMNTNLDIFMRWHCMEHPLKY